MTTVVNADVQQIIARTIRAEIRAQHAYPVAPPFNGSKLDLMENPYTLPVVVRQALATRLADVAINRYPNPAALALKHKLKQRFHIADKHDVLLGAGSDEIITLLNQAIVAGGAIALSVEPAFSMYKLAALNCAGHYVGVSLNPDFSLDVEAMLAAIKREQPRLIWLAYPNNPTGNLFPDSAIERIIQAAPGVVVLDEAYEPFAQRSWAPRLDEFPNLLVMRTLSKLGLAGVRLGYLIGHSAWIKEIDKVRSPFNLSVLQQATGEVLLDYYDELKRQTAALNSERDRLYAALQTMPNVVPFPSAANFVLARFTDATKIFESLKTRGLLVRNLSAQHPLMHNTLRLSVGTPDETTHLINAIGEITQ